MFLMKRISKQNKGGNTSIIKGEYSVSLSGLKTVKTYHVDREAIEANIAMNIISLFSITLLINQNHI